MASSNGLCKRILSENWFSGKYGLHFNNSLQMVLDKATKSFPGKQPKEEWRLLALEQVCNKNKEIYKKFEAVFPSDLSKFQSRIYPYPDSAQLAWYYIKWGNAYIGSIWAERRNTEDLFWTLGIFIADAAYRNRNIGFQAIQELIKQLESFDVRGIRLHVRENNDRAIRCYRKAGFAEEKRFQKENGISVLEMRRPL